MMGKYAKLARECAAPWPDQKNEGCDSISVLRPVYDPMPDDLKEFLLGNGIFELAKLSEDWDLEPHTLDGDGLIGTWDIYNLLIALENVRDGTPEVVTPSYGPTVPEFRYPAVPGRPDLVKEEWLEWLARRVPGVLYFSAYTGVA